VQHDLLALVLDRRDRAVQAHHAAEALGDAVTDLLAAPDEVVLLRSALELGQRLEAAARLEVEQEVEERQLIRLGTEDQLGREVDEHPRIPRAQVAACEGLHGLGVTSPAGGEEPRLIDAHLAAQALELELDHTELGERQR
jgi:hypothetical protein